MLSATHRRRLGLFIAVTILSTSLSASAALGQDRTRTENRVHAGDHARTADGLPRQAGSFGEERAIIEDLLQTIVGLVRDVTLAAPNEISTDRLFGLSDRLSGASNRLSVVDAGAGNSNDNQRSASLRADELEQVRRLLLDLIDQTVDVRQELRVNGEVELAEKMRDVENGLLDAVALVKKVEAQRPDMNDDVASNDAEIRNDRSGDFLVAGRYSDDAGQRSADRDRAAADARDDDAEYRSTREEWEAWAARERQRRAESRGREDWTTDAAPSDKARAESSTDRDWWEDCDGCDKDNRRQWRHRRGWDYDPGSLIGVHVGEFGYGWPYRETGAYRSIPAIRYNRVEGIVLGIRRLPLSWDSYDRARLYGHGGYAFGSKEWQYEIGAEARAGAYRHDRDIDVKFGGAYRKSTATDDIWKTSWVENSLAAFFFNYDFLDYFEVEGWTAYAALRLSPLFQITGAYRQEDYRSLSNEVTWSLFGGRDFRFNPPINSGDMNSVLVAVEGGSVADLDWLPRGVAFRAEAEFGRDFGGDFDFNRYVGDARIYLPFNDRSTLALRLRGGTSTGTLPLQKAFTLGGIGSMRSYPQNVFVGTRMLLGNVEYTMSDDWLWDDISLSGFFDAGWINNAGTDKFDFDAIYPSIGAGVGLIDRSLRIEISWPLRDIGGGREPSIWLRVNPAF